MELTGGERTPGGRYEDEDDPRRRRLLCLDCQAAALDAWCRRHARVVTPKAIIITRMVAAVGIRLQA